MTFITELTKELAKYDLLTHDFYKAWDKGELALETLKIYAREYYGHVAAFPRYISAIHSKCDNIEHRQILLGNLIEEEQGEENHPELWLRFAEGIGCSRKECQKTLLVASKELIDGYFELTNDSYEKGLGSLYAYESQTPEVSKTKIEGLQKHYKINDENTLKFFKEHQAWDIEHTKECEFLINALSDKKQEQVQKGAVSGAKLLWNFLDSMQEIHRYKN
ncbi:MAG: CADD family putative folate metabolism protein [Rickettsiaceae bacterium]|nr:CADD family putative folate metabolism protein [Rickettsiaceae bacterium]